MTQCSIPQGLNIQLMQSVLVLSFHIQQVANSARFLKVWNIILQKLYHLLLQVLHLSDIFIVYSDGQKQLIIQSKNLKSQEWEYKYKLFLNENTALLFVYHI
jgi:hypothetical protein